MKNYLILFLMTGLFITSCSKNDDVDVIEQEEEVKVAADYPVQNFMWQTMNTFYFWQGDVSDLSDDRFESITDPNYVAFLGSKLDPNAFFYSICNNHRNIVGDEAAIDRFSFLSENYKDLTQSLSGVTKSNGLEYGLSLFGDNGDVFGYIEYIVKDSDASTKDINRGDVFITVDGVQLFYNSPDDNNLNLLSDSDTYTLGLADIVNRTITPNNKEVTLTKQEGLAENPILINKVITQGGKKIGYLMYNSFVAQYDDQLNDVFGEFKAENISELILDFRYNGGGRVSSAIQIASAVYGPKTDELLLKARYNTKIQAVLTNGEGEENFTDVTLDSKAILNTLNLTKVYVIATNATASASELVMNGLAPYVEVVHIGSPTVGKNEFSNTFVDDPENSNYYNPSREDKINPNNLWAIQPLLGRNENASGFSDYTAGLLPNHELEEDIANMGILGNEDEPLLALTLSVISGASAKRTIAPIFPVNYIANSKLFKPGGYQMSMDGLIKPIIKN